MTFARAILVMGWDEYRSLRAELALAARAGVSVAQGATALRVVGSTHDQAARVAPSDGPDAAC